MGDAVTPVYENVFYKKVNGPEKEAPKNLLKQTQEQVTELVEILHKNVDKAMEREQKISELNKISETLENNAGTFKTQTIVVRRKEQRKRLKTKLVIAGLLSIFILIILFIIIQTFTMK